MPRFVILEHDQPMLHWDLMLESGAVLRTWRLASLPSSSSLETGEDKEREKTIAATAVFDHRLLYLDYEGPISGGRGRVVRCERGTFTGEVQGDPPIVVHLQGERLRGVLHLEHIKDNDWCCRFRADESEASNL